MKTSLTAISALGLAAGSLMLAAPAQAITNPADNPRPITVKGDDGQTYTDGEDTLPGYDDVECSYIPGAWFDFANNRVHYADGQSVTWTEWDRIAGYKSWLAKQAAAEPSKSGGSTSTPKADGTTTTPKSGTKTAVKAPSKAGTSTTKSGSTSSGTTSSSAGTSAAGSSSATARSTGSANANEPAASEAGAVEDESPALDAQATDAAKAAAEKDATRDATTTEGTDTGAGTDAGTDTAGASDDPEVIEAELTSGQRAEAASDEGGSAAGLLILGGLAAGAAALVGGWSLIGRRRKGAQL